MRKKGQSPESRYAGIVAGRERHHAVLHAILDAAERATAARAGWPEEAMRAQS